MYSKPVCFKNVDQADEEIIWIKIRTGHGCLCEGHACAYYPVPNPHCCPTLRQSFQHPQVQLSQYPLFNTRSSTHNPQANNTHYPTLQQSFQLIPTSCHHDHHNCHPFLSRVIMINDRRSRNRATLMYVPILKDLDKQMTCTCEWATIGQLVLMEMTWREEQSKAGGLDKLRHREDEVIL